MKRVKQMASFLIVAAIIWISLSQVLANAAVKDNVSKQSGVIDLSKTSKGVKISNALTYSQLVNEVAKNENLSIAKARVFLGSNSNIKSDDEGTYRMFSQEVDITDLYTVTLQFYCKTSEGGGYCGILQVLNSSINCCDPDLGITKGFSGNLYVNLENSDNIYYELNGDFLNNDTTTTSGTSTSPNEYKYVDITGHYKIGAGE